METEGHRGKMISLRITEAGSSISSETPSLIPSPCVPTIWLFAANITHHTVPLFQGQLLQGWKHTNNTGAQCYPKELCAFKGKKIAFFGPAIWQVLL